MVEKIKRNFGLILLLVGALGFYYPFLFFSQLPIPSDTIIGLYHPYRDFYAKEYPNGIPFKNYLVTDPVRQTYVWKELAIDIFGMGEIPSWNPYEMAGKPLAANFQSGAFYPLNILLFLKPFYIAWSVFVLIQTVMALAFSYLFLKNLKLQTVSSLMGSFAFAFSGFSVSWLEWGNILHTAVWTPLILFAIDRVTTAKNNAWIWSILLISSLSASLLGGHIQIFFYITIFSFSYFFLRWFEHGKKRKVFVQVALSAFISMVITIPQWVPGLQFIGLSARSMDQNFQDIVGWFLPWQNLVQFVAPDFFGNPTTLNYYGVWNYAEFIGYIGIIPISLVFAAFFRKSSTSIFFGIVTITALIFALPTGFSSLPFILDLPFISTAQPSRLIFIISFALSMLSAFGLQFYIDKKKNLKIINFLPFLIIAIIIPFLWMTAFFDLVFFSEAGQSKIALRNLVFPSVVFVLGFAGIILMTKINSQRVKHAILFLVLLVVVLDLLRFAYKFTPFTDSSYLFPTTKTIEYLQSQEGVFRIASADNRIFAPNFFTHYRLQSIEGYDPLYLSIYADFIAIMEQNKGNPQKPYGFNRIITPHNYKSHLFDFLNVKYLLSLQNIEDENYQLVFQEGETRVYENLSFVDRVFFVEDVVVFNDLSYLLDYDLKKTALVKSYEHRNKLSVGEASITKYSENEIIIKTRNTGDGFLVISDVYYPTWSAFIDGMPSKIYQTNHAFRGILVPRGEHEIVMKNSLF